MQIALDPYNACTATQNQVLRSVYEYWNARRGNRPFPQPCDIDPLVGFARGRLSLVEVLKDPIRYRFRSASSVLTRYLADDMSGKYVDDIADLEFS